MKNYYEYFKRLVNTYNTIPKHYVIIKFIFSILFSKIWLKYTLVTKSFKFSSFPLNFDIVVVNL